MIARTIYFDQIIDRLAGDAEQFVVLRIKGGGDK
jgi:hypothetical protein